MTTQRKFFRAAAALMLIMAFGCQSSSAPATQASAAPQNAVVVNYPNGGGTTVFLKPSDGTDPVMLSSSGTTVCPECKAAAIKYFQTGVLDPKCSLTGATRVITGYVPPSISHN